MVERRGFLQALGALGTVLGVRAAEAVVPTPLPVPSDPLDLSPVQAAPVDLSGFTEGLGNLSEDGPWEQGQAHGLSEAGPCEYKGQWDNSRILLTIDDHQWELADASVAHDLDIAGRYAGRLVVSMYAEEGNSLLDVGRHQPLELHLHTGGVSLPFKGYMVRAARHCSLGGLTKEEAEFKLIGPEDAPHTDTHMDALAWHPGPWPDGYQGYGEPLVSRHAVVRPEFAVNVQPARKARKRRKP